MVKENECCVDGKKRWHHHSGGMFGGTYGLIFIAVAVYYVQQSDTFWMGVLGVIKALVWPAMLAYKVFSLLNM